MEMTAPLTQMLTLRARPIKPAGATLPGVVLPARKYLWYYVAAWPDGTAAASLHLGEGIVPAGETAPWRILRRDRTRTLLRQGALGLEPVATYGPGGSGIDGEFFRLREGDSPQGGFDIFGRGWRGGVLLSRGTQERVLRLRGQGDPPDVYFLEPLPSAAAPPSLAAALLLAYVLTEREVREGSWIKRPPR